MLYCILNNDLDNVILGLTESATSLNGTTKIAAINNGKTGEMTISFSKTFNTIPEVIVSTNVYYLVATVTNITKGGFTVSIKNNGPDSSGTLTWNATADNL